MIPLAGVGTAPGRTLRRYERPLAERRLLGVGLNFPDQPELHAAHAQGVGRRDSGGTDGKQRDDRRNCLGSRETRYRRAPGSPSPAEYGEWNGHTIISADYLKRATPPRTPIPATDTCSGPARDARRIPNSCPPTPIPCPDSARNTSSWCPAWISWSCGPKSRPLVGAPLSVDYRSCVDGDIALAMFGGGADAYPDCTAVSCLDLPLATAFGDAPPGCLLPAGVGPDPRTPGIR